MPDQLTPELLDLRERMLRFIDDDLRPLEERAATGDSDERELSREVIARSRELGFFGMTQPEEFGGTQAGPLTLAVVRETLAAANLGVTRSVFGPGPGALRGATGLLREQYLEPVMRGEKRGSFAFTEPSGADAGRPTWARRDGDDLVVNGRKPFVTGGHVADFISVFVTVEEDGGGPSGPAMLIVDAGTPGLVLDPQFSTLDGATHCPLRFEEMRVPQSHVLGTIGEGMPQALGNIGQMRLGLAATACGTAMWVVNYVFETLQEREAAGGPPGLRDQARAALGQMMMETYVARSAFYRSARLAETGADILNEGSIAKLFAAEAAGRIVDQAIQVIGAQSLIEGHPLARLFRVTRSWRFSEGSSEMLRGSIARGMLEFDSGRV